MLTFTHSIFGGQVHLKFSGKPEANIRGILKANGYRWNPADGDWWKRGVTGAADFIGALRKKLGPRTPDGDCWECKSPEGYFRNHGAATPVYCDACHAKHQEPAEAVDLLGVDAAYEDACRDACGL